LSFTQSNFDYRRFGLDNITRMAADHKSPGQIINEIVHEKIASSS
jgi:hypothetical protein